jgi:putative mycofactocin binding protein MftB
MSTGTLSKGDPETASPKSTLLSGRYRVHPLVAVRPEPFGALVYHYGNRKLVFLKNHRMVAVVNSLNGDMSIGEALTQNHVPASSVANYLSALESMVQSNMLELAA